VEQHFQIHNFNKWQLKPKPILGFLNGHTQRPLGIKPSQDLGINRNPRPKGGVRSTSYSNAPAAFEYGLTTKKAYQ